MSHREEKLQVVSVLDPAVDIAAMGYEKLGEYLKTRQFDLIRPYFVAGQQPAIFHIKEVPEHLWEEFVADDTVNLKVRYKRAMRAGLVSVDHLYQRDGTRISSGAFVRGSDDLIPGPTIARIAGQFREEIGEVIYDHSFFDLRTLDCFLLPHTLGEALHRRMQRSVLPAASSPSSPEATSSETALQGSASTP